MNAKILGTLLAATMLAGVGAAVQFASSTTDQNLIASHLEGSWVIDTDLTARLDPQRPVEPAKTMDFYRDDYVMKVLTMNEPRFASLPMYMGGTLLINGYEKHPFVVVNENGNARLLVMTPSLKHPVGTITSININMIVNRAPRLDLLFLGGDVARESAVAYRRR